MEHSQTPQSLFLISAYTPCPRTHCNALQRTATHYNALQRTTTHCDALQRTATHCNALQRTTTHCNVLQRTATHYHALQRTATHCIALPHPVTHCNTTLAKLAFKPTRSVPTSSAGDNAYIFLKVMVRKKNLTFHKTFHVLILMVILIFSISTSPCPYVLSLRHCTYSGKWWREIRGGFGSRNCV